MPVEPRVTVHGRVRPLADAAVRRAVEAVLAGERAEAEVSVTFLGREAMRRLNARYKGQDRPTDVIAFPLAAPDGRVVGDVYVCPWVARREAAAREVPPRQELIRLVVHGTLHVLGWDDTNDDDRTAMLTRQRELMPG